MRQKSKRDFRATDAVELIGIVVIIVLFYYMIVL